MKYYKARDNSPHGLSDQDIANGGEKCLPEGCVQITESEAEALRPKPPAPTYAQLRAAEYPPLLDLIDGLVKDDQAQVQAYKDACLAVKAKYPKP